MSSRRNCVACVLEKHLLTVANGPTSWSWCRDNLQAKLKLLDRQLDTAKAEQETAKTCCQELEEELAAEQYSTKHLQEQHDCEVQQRCRSSTLYA